MKVMASISGFSGRSVTLYALSDPATGVLAIAKEGEFSLEADEGVALVTNTRAESYDCLFTEEHLAQASRDYLVGLGDETVALNEKMMRHKPRIETDGVDEKGQKYRLHEDTTNGELAVLALVHFDLRQKAIATAESAMDDMYDWITI